MNEHNKESCDIHRIPDHSLWMIFEELSLEQIICLRRVCQRWRCLIDDAFGKQTHLKLFASKNDLVRYKQRQMEFNLNRRTIYSIHRNEVLILRSKSIKQWSRTLVSHFPNIETLLIETSANKMLQFDLIDAIHEWRRTLKHLALIGWSECSSPKFWHILDSIDELESLILFGLYRNKIPDNMECFRKLTNFTLVHYLHDVVPVFRQFGPNIKFMLISWIYLSVPQLEQIVAENPSLTTSLETLRLGYISSVTEHGVDREKNFRQILQYFAINFKNIHRLSILFADSIPLIEIANVCVHMKNLTRLSFYLSREQLPNYEKINWSNIPVLKSITSLYVEIFAIEAEMFHFWIDPLFPSLKELTVKTNIDKDDDKFRILEEQLLVRFKRLDYILVKN